MSGSGLDVCQGEGKLASRENRQTDWQVDTLIEACNVDAVSLASAGLQPCNAVR